MAASPPSSTFRTISAASSSGSRSRFGAVAAVAAAGALIYKYWEPLKAFFAGFLSGLATGFAPLSALIQSAFAPIAQVGRWFMELLTPISATSEMTKSWGEAGKIAGEAVATTIRLIIFPLQTALDLISQGVNKFREWKNAASGAVGGAAQSVSDWWNGGSKPGVAGARAKGGPVRAGSTYLVGEQGPELWQAPGNGRIIPNGKTMAAVRGYQAASIGGGRGSAGAGGGPLTIAPVLHFHGISDLAAVAQEVGQTIGREIEQTFRSVHADVGIA